jgi:hypothetical protein
MFMVYFAHHVFTNMFRQLLGLLQCDVNYYKNAKLQIWLAVGPATHKN